MVYVLADGGAGATGRLHCLFTAATDAPTVVSMAQHSYWNLGGHSSGDVLGHRLTVSACACCSSCCPTFGARQRVYAAAGLSRTDCSGRQSNCMMWWEQTLHGDLAAFSGPHRFDLKQGASQEPTATRQIRKSHSSCGRADNFSGV